MDTLVEKCLGENVQKPSEALFEGKFLLHGNDGGVILSTESFTHLELDVENCKDVYASFDKFVEGFTNSHVNTRYDYPYQLDLDRKNGKYLSRDAERSIPNLYTLYSVIVHSGVEEDDYSAIIRPTLKNFWNTNAFMLIYIREGADDTVLCKIDQNEEKHKEEAIIKSDTLTGICALCPGRINPEDDIEDYGTKLKKAANVTKMPRK